MATPWEQVLAEVPALNNPQAPFSYTVDNGAIVGYWDVAKIQMLGLAGASSYSKDYRITVTAAGDGAIDFTEIGNESEVEVGGDGLSFSASTFKGKQRSFSFGATAGVAGTSHGEPTNVAGWSFNDQEIKKPLFDFLEQRGWKKKGFFAKLFG